MTEKEIIQKLEQFKEGLELFKSNLDAEREKNEELLKENTALEIENNYLKTQHPAPDVNKNYDDIKIQLDDLQVRLDDAETLADQKVKEAQEARELAEKIEKKNESLQADLKEKEENSNTQQLDDQIIDLENDKNVLQGLVQERDYTIKELEEKLQKAKDDNKSLAEESLSNKTDISKERDKLAKKLSESEKENNELKSLLKTKEAEYNSLQNEYTSLKVGYEKYKAQAKRKPSIVSIPESSTEVETHHYVLGTTSEGVMNKFISVINEAFASATPVDGKYKIENFEEASADLGINLSDTSVITSRLLNLKNMDGENIFSKKDNILYSSLNKNELIKWISTVKD